jgi:hypothetical protein
VLSAGLFSRPDRLRLLAERRYDELVETIVSAQPIPFVRDQSLFSYRDALNAVRNEFDRHVTAPDPISSMFLWNRTRRDIGSSAFSLLAPSGQITCAPFLDPEVVDYLSRLTPDVTGDKTFHDQTIARAFPECTVRYEAKCGPDRSEYRPNGLVALRYTAGVRSPLIHRGKVAMRLVAAMALPSRLDEARWVSTIGTYLSQITSPLQPET